MNSILKAGAATELKDLISYEEGSIANLDPAPCSRQRHPDRTGGQGHHRLRGPGLRADRRPELPF